MYFRRFKLQPDPSLIPAVVSAVSAMMDCSEGLIAAGCTKQQLCCSKIDDTTGDPANAAKRYHVLSGEIAECCDNVLGSQHISPDTLPVVVHKCHDLFGTLLFADDAERIGIAFNGDAAERQAATTLLAKKSSPS